MSRLDLSALRAVAEEILVGAGAASADARDVADVMVWADHRSRHPQGVIWLDTLSERLCDGSIRSPATFVIDSPQPARAVIDAGDGLGAVAGKRAIAWLVESAATHGVAIAAVRNSSHFGPCGFYAAALADKDFVGIVATNAYPKVAPHGARAAVLGTNPLAFAAPVDGQPPIIGDLSTGAVAGSRLRAARLAGRRVEPGALLDSAGRPTEDPAALDDGGVMLPFGGAKGSALGLLVEILTSGLADGAAPDAMGSMFGPEPAGTSHFFLAIAAPEGLGERVAHLRRLVEAAPARDGMEIRLPGDDGHRSAAAGTGIELPPESLAALETAAARTGVDLGSRFS